MYTHFNINLFGSIRLRNRTQEHSDVKMTVIVYFFIKLYNMRFEFIAYKYIKQNG